jgi:hypothetical protein
MYFKIKGVASLFGRSLIGDGHLRCAREKCDVKMTSLRGNALSRWENPPPHARRDRSTPILGYLPLRIPRHVGPPFHVMPGRYSTASRATVPR